MTTHDFNRIDRHIGERVSFKYTDVMTGKEEIHHGTIQGVYGDCIILVNENLHWRSLVHHTDVYLG